MARVILVVSLCLLLIEGKAYAQVSPSSDPSSSGPKLVVFMSSRVPTEEKNRVLNQVALLGLVPARIENFSARDQNGILFKAGFRPLAEKLGHSLRDYERVEIEENAWFDVAVDVWEKAGVTESGGDSVKSLEKSEGPEMQHQSAIHVTGFFGVDSPLGRIGDTFGSLLGGGATIGYPWADDTWAVEAAVEFYQITAVPPPDEDTGDPIPSRIWFLPISLSILHTFNSTGTVRPYFGFGPALQQMDVSDTRVFDQGPGGARELARGYVVRAGVWVRVWNRVLARAELGWIATQALFAEKRGGEGIRFALGLGF